MNKNKDWKIAIKIIPTDIIGKYDLKNKQIYGYIYGRLKRGVWGLVQAGIIAHKLLKVHLKSYVCAPANITQGIWTHHYRQINSTLLLDEFGMNSRDKKDVDRIIASLRAKYEVTQDCTGGIYCGITLKWE